MKIFRLLLLITLCLFLKISAESFEEISYIQRGVHPSMSFTRQQTSDYNNDFDEELIINNGRKILFYEYQSENTYILNDSIVDTNLIWTSGVGDFDQDGLKDLLVGIPGDDDYMHLRIFEQSDITSFFDNLVWQSDTLYISVYYLSITNKLKGDGVDRIFGAGIPWLTTPTKGYGWYYFTCTGDNQYELLNTFGEGDWIQSAMDIGDIDGNGLTDVVITSPENYLYFYESEKSGDTSFIKQDSLTEGGYGSGALLILPDIDRDGTNEVMKYQINYLGPPNSYAFIIYEDTSGTGVYDTIWRRDFEVETDAMFVLAGDMDYGDVDGDSLNELVICGGRHVEVWESTGDNQFEMSWDYTDPTYKTIQSHIKCHDFNKNGVEEIVFSGCGQSVGDECTRIFEMKRWAMEGETLVIGNSEEGDTIRKDLVIRNESDGEINIDSMKISSAYFGLTTMTWPLTINGNDSAEVEVWFKGDSTGRYFDSMEVYADRSMTMEYLRAGNELELMLDSIKAFDGMNPISGIDEDDIVVFYFDWGTNKPDINAGNIDSLLRLSGGDEWDIAGEGIELTKWLSYPGGDRFYVYFDASGKIPTVKVGDTVYTDSQTVIGTWCGERWKRPVVITGSFGPTGIEERREPYAMGIWDSTCTVPTIKNQYIIWNTTDKGTLTVYDISGREVIREETTKEGEHKTDIGHLKNGIYFVKLKTESQSITEKMVRIR